MKSKSLILMVLSLGFGLIAAVGISQVMGRNHNTEAPAIKTRTILVAADDLEYKTLLTSQNVREEQWPIDIIPSDAITSLDQISEMATKTFVAKKMPISRSSIVHLKQLNNIHIPRGLTVIHIKVSADDTGNGLLQPGDRVNLIGYIKSKPAKTFLRGLRVFAVNAQLTPKTGSREEQVSKNDAIVGILANERQAEMIMQVQREGYLKLSFLGEHFDADEEGGQIDEDGVRGLGLLDFFPNTSENGGRGPISLVKSTLSSDSGEVSPTMKVWSASGLEIVSFRDGVVDQQPSTTKNLETSPSPFPTSQQLKSNSDGWGKSGDFNDPAKDSEENQYPS
jgi:pilus assembly protein CpaB